MQPQRNNTKKEIQGNALKNAFDNFMLSRQAMRCSPNTITFYRATARVFIIWTETQHGVSEPQQINSQLVREYLAELGCRTTSDWTVNDHARAIRTLVRFWHAEGVILQPVIYKMPRIRKKKMPVLSSDELRHFIASCNTRRDKAIILLIADSGIRRSEAVALNWSDLNLENGLCYVNSGKGGKSRVTIFGPSTRQALLEYRETMMPTNSQDPLIMSKFGTRFTSGGFMQIFLRISKRAGIHVTPHTLRRTFVKLALRSNMNPLYLKDLLGHASLEMVMYYAGQFDEEELLEAYHEHSPIENLLKLTASL